MYANIIKNIIKECIWVKFLSEHRAEAKKMSIYEYDQEKHLRMERRDAKAEGIAEGRNELLEELVKKKLQKNKSPEIIAEELEEDISVIENVIIKVTQ